MAKPKNQNDNLSAKNDSKKIEIEVEEKDKEVKKAKVTAQESAGSEKTDGKQTDDKQAEALKSIQEELASEKDKYLRLAAEYDNFRKRNAKERDMIYTNAKADIIGKLLPVYDNLERALKLECSDEAYYKGIEMTMLQLTEILKDIGVTPIAALGEAFDPNLHDAVMRIEDPNLGEGIIAEECQKGFAIGDRIVRHSTVVVAN